MTLSVTLIRWTARILLTSVRECIDWEDVDLAEYVDDERLADAVDWDDVDPYEHGLDPDEHLAGPVDRLHRLDDVHDDIYVWETETERGRDQVTHLIDTEYREQYGREPNACHIVVHDLEELREFEADDLRPWVAPGQNGGGS